MAAKKENSITDWKKLWQLVSGIHYETPNETVRQKLFDVSKELQDGVLQFKKCSSSSADLEKFLKEKKQEKLFPFTNKLQQLLDLETEQCWDLLCYYLINEYRGSATSLSNFIATESNMTKLLDDIWGYYSLERIIVFKIVKNMVEFHKGTGHPYATEYKYVLDKISLEKLRHSVLNQLEYLIKENPPAKLVAGEFFNYNAKLVAWSERNTREITEVLHILILLIQNGAILPSEVKKMLDCFKHHSFGRQQRFLDASNDCHKDLITKIAYSEIAIFMLCTDLSRWSQNSDFITEIVNLLDKDIVLLHHNSEHGPLLLSWMLLNFRNPNALEDEETARKYQQFGVKAVQLDVFKFLKDVVSHRMFKGKSLICTTVQDCVYNHLSHLCDLFDADGSIGQHPYVYDLLCELISSRQIAKAFIMNEEGGVRSLYNTALENFPIDFVNLSMISYGLSTAGMHEFVRNQLENLPIYTDIYEESKFQLRPSIEAEDEFVLQHDYTPFRHIDYTIPAGTNVVVMNKMDRTLMHFRTSINYFNVLHNEINLLISEAVQYTGLDEDRIKRVNAGIKYLSDAISKIKSPSEISQEMIHPTEMCIDILNKLKNLPFPPIELLANCLNVFAALVPLFEVEISTRVINLNIFPCLTNEMLDFKKYSHGICFDSNLVGSYLVNFEKKLEKYDFLMAYLNFLRIYSRLGKDKLHSMEIPGLIFLLREVFPHMQSWRFESPEERNKIYMQIMRYICEVLDITTDKSENGNSKSLLRDICVYSLLSLDNGIVLLKFVAIGNPFLQHSMENECNWIVSSTTSILLLVRLAMKILMSLLRLKTTIFEASTLSPLEALIYTQPKQTDTLRIIPVVTSYMSNIFDRWLPILSCRLLRRIALEFKMSLLACLDMEPDQIRLTFLQKLLDDLESDDLKIAILEFIEACIEKQPGLTEAFFKMNHEKDRRLFVKDKTSNIGDSILPFMQDYLEAVAKDPSTVEGPLPSRIMSLFHTLWRNNMQSLVQQLVDKPTFWSSLCNPLFGTLKNDVKAYSQLLNVLGIELFGCDGNIKLKEDLKKVLQKFFEESYFEKWIDHVFVLPESSIKQFVPEETPEWLSRLQAFKDFVVILLKKNVKTLEIPSKKMRMFAIKCLQVLVHRAECTDDLRPFIILSELYLVVLLSFKHSYTETEKEDQEMLQNIVKLLNNVALCYEDLHPRAKESCLSIAIKSTELLSTELLKDSMSALQYLNPIVDIICFELNNFEKSVKADGKQPKTEMQQQHINSLILSLNLLKTAAVIFSTEGPSNWDQSFISHRILNRLLDCITWILPISTKHKLSNELMDVLIVFAKGNCSMEFIHCDVGNCLWLKLLPPKELLQTPYILQQPKENSWVMQNWWPIYSKGIELVTILLQKHTQHFLRDALLFVGIHEEYLMDSLLLAKHSLERNAMNLVKTTAELISNLIVYEKEWRLEHSQSLFNLVRCIQTLMHHAISLLYRPKILKRLVDGINSQPETMMEMAAPFYADEILTAMNDLCEIIAFCAESLLRFSPKLLDLVCEPEFLVSQWEPLIEVQFGAPKLDAGSYPQLTFGAVLSAVAIFIKALTLQNYGFHEVPLNILPTKSNGSRKHSVPSSPRESSFGLEKGRKRTPSSSRTPFLKSMSVTSMTSISSTTAPSIELLSNMDGELCLISLELILTLLASQSLLALKNTNLSSREKQLIRREISTELIVFHDFVRKKVLIDPNYHKSIWYRRKHGVVMMMDNNGDSAGPKTRPPDVRRNSDKNSMRVGVIRRLHLMQQQQQPSNFEMSQVISPIAGPSKKSALNLQTLSSTPNMGQTGSDDSEPPQKRTSSLDSEEDDIEYFEAKDPEYSPLSYVQLVEEDYLHCLSNLFTVICQSD